MANPIQPDEQPFTIGQTVYLREGMNTGYGCEPLIIVAVRWHDDGGDAWDFQVGRWSQRFGLADYSEWLDPSDLVLTRDAIDPNWRDCEAADAAV